MSDKDRQRRLGEASSLHEAINSLGKVNEEHRIGFVHDRLMSAIDDICAKQKSSASKFSPTQIDILKDVAFAMVYIMDPRTQKRAGFFSRLWSEFKAQSALKQTGLASGAAIAVIAIIGGVYSGFQAVRPLVAPAVAKSFQEPAERPRSLLNELNSGNVPSDFRAPQPRFSPSGR